MEKFKINRVGDLKNIQTYVIFFDNFDSYMGSLFLVNEFSIHLTNVLHISYEKLKILANGPTKNKELMVFSVNSDLGEGVLKECCQNWSKQYLLHFACFQYDLKEIPYQDINGCVLIKPNDIITKASIVNKLLGIQYFPDQQGHSKKMLIIRVKEDSFTANMCLFSYLSQYYQILLSVDNSKKEAEWINDPSFRKNLKIGKLLAISIYPDDEKIEEDSSKELEFIENQSIPHINFEFSKNFVLSNLSDYIKNFAREIENAFNDLSLIDSTSINQISPINEISSISNDPNHSSGNLAVSVNFANNGSFFNIFAKESDLKRKINLEALNFCHRMGNTRGWPKHKIFEAIYKKNNLALDGGLKHILYGGDTQSLLKYFKEDKEIVSLIKKIGDKDTNTIEIQTETEKAKRIFEEGRNQVKRYFDEIPTLRYFEFVCKDLGYSWNQSIEKTIKSLMSEK